MGVRRSRRWILRPAAFGITEGVIGIAGPRGAGKTTLLATFATLRRPRAGSLEILGFDTGKAAGLRSARARIGYLPDHFSWAGHLSVQEFVAYSAYYKGMRSEAVATAVRRMELEDVAGVALDRLPADLRLRAGLAATCVHGPELVLLDDPFAGLGDRAPAELAPLLRTLGRTVLITGEAAGGPLADTCERIYLLSRGRLAETQSPEPAGPARRRAATGRTWSLEDLLRAPAAAASTGDLVWTERRLLHAPQHLAPVSAALMDAVPAGAVPAIAVPADTGPAGQPATRQAGPAATGRRLVAVPAGRGSGRHAGPARLPRGGRSARPAARPPAPGRGIHV